jgi:glycosyltransferase involved in cell wall biosynthesis
MQNIVPIKLYEYMAMKKPIIATRLPGLVSEFGENNGIVYIDRPEEVIKVVKTLMNDNQSMNKIGWAGYNFVKDNDWRKLTIKFERILEDLILDMLLRDI